MEYAHKILKQFRFFQAEQVFKVLKGTSNQDLLSLEDRFAEYSDCIIVIVESPGAVAELGAFSLKDDIANIVLGISDSKYKNEFPFITAGPMAKLAKVSRFGPPIYTKLEAILKASPEITTRFSAVARPRARFVDLRTFKAFQSNGSSVQILFLVELISLFSPITFLVLIHLLEACYGKKSYKIDIHLSIVEPLKLIEGEEIKSTPYYVRSLGKRELFFEYSGFNPITVKARVFNY